MTDPFPFLDADLSRRTFTPNPDPAKGEKQDEGNVLLQETVDALIEQILPALTGKVGTRKYGAGSRVAVGVASALSGVIAATEVMVVASTKQYVLAVVGTGTPTVDATSGIPMEAGEKFHLQIESGQRIATIRDSADGFLHIFPVVA
jgi:hypothetical protein